MKVEAEELRSAAAEVIAAVLAGEKVELSVRGDVVADIVPRAPSRSRWLSGQTLQEALATRQAEWLEMDDEIEFEIDPVGLDIQPADV